MKYLLLVISLIFTLNVNAQTTAKNFSAGADIDRDTLIVDGKVYLLKTSFIKTFDNYRKLFKSNEVLICMIPETKGYIITWVVKKGNLYIDHLWLANGVSYGTTKEGEQPHEIKPVPISGAEIQKRLELLTGRKFNKEGLLPADWVTGEKKANANGHYVNYIDSRSYISDENYIFNFENGLLKKVDKI